MLRQGQTLFTYLHLAPAPELTKGLCESNAICVAYETVEDGQGRLPLLAPMSEVAGKIATQAGAFMLEKPLGGRGILLGGVPGVPPANVMVIGGGAVGMHAASIAIGMEADVFVYDVSLEKLRELDVAFAGRASTVFSSTLSIEEKLPEMDLVIGGVLVHGARAPHVITRKQLGLMKPARGAGRRRDRPGRLLRDLAPDHPRRPDLRGRRDHPLLRHQHARRGADHLDLRAHQRDPAVRARARRPRGRRGGAARPRAEARDQRRRRQGHPPGRRRGRRHGLRPAGGGARDRCPRRRGPGIATAPGRPPRTRSRTETEQPEKQERTRWQP